MGSPRSYGSGATQHDRDGLYQHDRATPPATYAVDARARAANLSHLTSAERATLALWSFAATITEHVGPDHVCRLPSPKPLGGSENTLRQRLREFYRPAAHKRGTHRRELDVRLSFGPLLRWALRLPPPAGGRARARPDALPGSPGRTHRRRRGTRVRDPGRVGGRAGQRAWCVDASLEADARPTGRRRACADAGGRGRRPGPAEHRALRRDPRVGLASYDPAGPARSVARAGGRDVDETERAPARARRALRRAWPPLLDQAARLHAGGRVAGRLRRAVAVDDGLVAGAVRAGRSTGCGAGSSAASGTRRSGGLRCERLRVTDPARAERVWLVLAVSLLWTHAVGATPEEAECLPRRRAAPLGSAPSGVGAATGGAGARRLVAAAPEGALSPGRDRHAGPRSLDRRRDTYPCQPGQGESPEGEGVDRHEHDVPTAGRTRPAGGGSPPAEQGRCSGRSTTPSPSCPGGGLSRIVLRAARQPRLCRTDCAPRTTPLRSAELDLVDDGPAEVPVHPVAPGRPLERELVPPRRRADLDVEHAVPHPHLLGLGPRPASPATSGHASTARAASSRSRYPYRSTSSARTARRGCGAWDSGTDDGGRAFQARPAAAAMRLALLLAAVASACSADSAPRRPVRQRPARPGRQLSGLDRPPERRPDRDAGADADPRHRRRPAGAVRDRVSAEGARGGPRPRRRRAPRAAPASPSRSGPTTSTARAGWRSRPTGASCWRRAASTGSPGSGTPTATAWPSAASRSRPATRTRSTSRWGWPFWTATSSSATRPRSGATLGRARAASRARARSWPTSPARVQPALDAERGRPRRQPLRDRRVRVERGPRGAAPRVGLPDRRGRVGPRDGLVRAPQPGRPRVPPDDGDAVHDGQRAGPAGRRARPRLPHLDRPPTPRAGPGSTGGPTPTSRPTTSTRAGSPTAARASGPTSPPGPSCRTSCSRRTRPRSGSSSTRPTEGRALRPSSPSVTTATPSSPSAGRGIGTRGRATRSSRVPFESGRPLGHYEDFLTGFLIDPAGPTAWGRPVGLLVLPDGSLLMTEESNGRIYRVSYTGDE